MLWSDKAKLQACEKLKLAGIKFPMVPGTQVARGFADLGYEEFIIIAEGQIVSLLTGVRGEIPAEHARHFFVIPDIDQICEAFAVRGWALERADFIEQRYWRIRARSRADALHEVEDRSLSVALVLLLLKIHSIE